MPGKNLNMLQEGPFRAGGGGLVAARPAARVLRAADGKRLLARDVLVEHVALQLRGAVEQLVAGRRLSRRPLAQVVDGWRSIRNTRSMHF